MTNDFPLPSENMEGQDSIEVIQETLDKFLDSASVYAVYGEPIEHGDTAIIPTAEVLNFMGFGFGSGAGPKDEEGESSGSGSGGGGGGRVLSRPVAVIVASPEGVRVEPVVDVTKVALAALTAAGFMLGMLLRMRPSRRGLQNIDNL
jgi:uncharacterized spore protein YtfJ